MTVLTKPEVLEVWLGILVAVMVAAIVVAALMVTNSGEDE